MVYRIDFWESMDKQISQFKKIGSIRWVLFVTLFLMMGLQLFPERKEGPAILNYPQSLKLVKVRLGRYHINTFWMILTIKNDFSFY